jgi:4-hydroxy-2-oxoheptanedioate aldolase
MTTPFDFRKRLRTGNRALSAWIGQDPRAAVTFSRMDFDAVTFDMQHGRLGQDDMLKGITFAALASKPVLVRIPVGEFQMASRILDMGAIGIIAPMINSAAQARQFVSFCKYSPVGDRSWGPIDAIPFSGLDAQGYLHQANDLCLALAMIETQEALDGIDEILSTPGLDGVFVGPHDLAVSISAGRSLDTTSKQVEDALRAIASSCIKHSKVAGIYCGTGESALHAQKLGYQLMGLGSDQTFLISAGQNALAVARS